MPFNGSNYFAGAVKHWGFNSKMFDKLRNSKNQCDLNLIFLFHICHNLNQNLFHEKNLWCLQYFLKFFLRIPKPLYCC
jgi:hypothetical protein